MHTIELRFPRARDLEKLAGGVALYAADLAGLPRPAGEDIEMAVCEACTALAGRFFVGACEAIAVRIQIRAEGVRVTAFGSGERVRGPEAERPLDPHEADMSLAVLRGLMDRVTLIIHSRHGVCVVMRKSRNA